MSKQTCGRWRILRWSKIREREGEIDFRSGRRMRFSFLNMCKLEMPFDIGGDGRRQAYI